MKYIIFSLLYLTMQLSSGLLFSQSTNDLQAIPDKGVPVYYSKGYEDRAQSISVQMNHALNYGDSFFHFRPEVKLLILSQEDWPGYTQFPVYGMPHYSDASTLIIAAEDNAFWDGFLPPLEKLDNETAEKIKQIYRDEEGGISMMRFFDLVGLHELAHAFHKQANIHMQRKWMQEYFANSFMFAYVADREPEYIPVVKVFSEMVVNSGTHGFEYTTLKQFEDNYHQIAKSAPKNYGWYQCKFNLGAIDVYNDSGSEALTNLWEFLANTEEISHDTVLIDKLASEVDGSMAKVFRDFR